MKLDTKLSVAIRLAEKANACEESLNELRSFGDVTLQDVINHESAPYWAYWFSLMVLRSPWKEAESIIATNPEWAYWYAVDILKERFKEAEPSIATDSDWAYLYAKYIIRGDWPEANIKL